MSKTIKLKQINQLLFLILKVSFNGFFFDDSASSSPYFVKRLSIDNTDEPISLREVVRSFVIPALPSNFLRRV